MNKPFTVKDIQEILGVCEKTAYNLVHQAITTKTMFKVRKIGRLYRIPRDPFLDWLDNAEM